MNADDQKAGKNGGIQVTKGQATIGGAALLAYVLFNHGAQKIVTHPEEEFGHRAVYRHEEELGKVHGGIGKLTETIERLERERVQREERDRADADRNAKQAEENRRAEWRAQAAERDAKLIDAIRQSLVPAPPTTTREPR